MLKKIYGKSRVNGIILLLISAFYDINVGDFVQIVKMIELRNLNFYQLFRYIIKL